MDVVSILLQESQIAAGSAVSASVSFRTRSTGAASTPTSIRYRVDCLTTGQQIINDTSVSAASSATIVIGGTYNEILGDNDYEQKQLKVWADYGLTTQVVGIAKWRVNRIPTFQSQASFLPDLRLEPYYPITSAETAAGLVEDDDLTVQYPPGDVRRYGAVGDGTTDDTTAIQNAIDVGLAVTIPDGTYLTNNLTQSASFQNIIGVGKAHLRKNANGPLLTSSGDDVLFRNLDFRDDSSSYTGKGLVCSGDRVRVEYCGGFLIEDYALEMTGAAPQIIGTSNIWRTRTDAGYDISVGVSGTATLYPRIINVYTGNAGGGMRFIDCGSQMVTGCQFGKLTILAGTSPDGVNGGTYSNNRILGNVTVNLSNSSFAANQFSTITITLAGGTSGHNFGASNLYADACTIVDNAVESVIVDTRESSTKTYTVTWTGAVSDPAIGNGTLAGRYMKVGKLVYVWIRMTAGTTTTFGSGAWSFSVPFIPATFGVQVGSARVLDSGTNFRTGVANTIADGTARIRATIDSDTAGVDSGRPIAWTTSDELYISIAYLTN